MKTILTLLLYLIASIAHSENVYIRDGGSGSGAAWNDALDDLPTTLSRSNTYYVADGSYGGHTFNTAVSGTTAITVKKATVADHGTSTGWLDAYGDGVATFTGELNFTTSYWVLDGITGGGPGSWESGHGFKIDRSASTGAAKCVRLSADNITISHVEMENPGEDVTGSADNVYTLGADNITVEYCWIHSTNRTCFLVNGSQNWTVQYCLLSDRHANDGTHGEHMSLNSNGADANFHIRFNILRDSAGTGTIVIKDSVQSGFNIYGNLFYATDRDRYYNTNGIITDSTGDTCTGIKVYNNTFLPIKGAATSDTSTMTFDVNTGNEFKNNIVVNSGGASGTRSHNLYFAATYSGETGGQHWTGTQAQLFTDPTNYDFSLLTATNAGTTLASPYNADWTGATRGADGVWDRGALDLTGEGEGEPPSTPSITADTLNADTVTIE